VKKRKEGKSRRRFGCAFPFALSGQYGWNDIVGA